MSGKEIKNVEDYASKYYVKCCTSILSCSAATGFNKENKLHNLMNKLNKKNEGIKENFRNIITDCARGGAFLCSCL
jgi:hypothetical protein